MSVILKNINMPIGCMACPFSKQLDNMRTFCEWNPSKPPQNIGDDIPEYCPLEEIPKEKSEFENIDALKG